MTDAPYRPEGGRHHVVVIGSGFGGLFAVQNLKNANVDIPGGDRYPLSWRDCALHPADSR